MERLRPKEAGKNIRLIPNMNMKDEKTKEAAKRARAEHHRKRVFVSHYLNAPNATKAAILSGYAPASADSQGSLLLKDPWVKEKIESALERMQARTEVSLEKVIRELALLGFSNMRDYVDASGYLVPQIDLTDLDPAAWAAVAEVTNEIYMEGHGDDAVPVKRVKIKLHDKLGSLDKLARILGGYKGKGGPQGDDEGAVPSVTNYTLQIGNANIVVNRGQEGALGGTEGARAEVLTLP